MLVLCFQISDALQESYATSVLWQFLSLGYALMLCPFVIVLGGMFFLATALFFLDDRDKAEKQWVFFHPITAQYITHTRPYREGLMDRWELTAIAFLSPTSTHFTNNYVWDMTRLLCGGEWTVIYTKTPSQHIPHNPNVLDCLKNVDKKEEVRERESVSGLILEYKAALVNWRVGGGCYSTLT